MHWGVCLLGAVSGGILTAGLWLGLRLPEEYVWAGGLIGLIAGGMISFIVFKIAVILFTSLGGSILLAVGVLAIIYDHLLTGSQLKDFIATNQWFVPAILFGPMAVGLYFQHKFIKSDQNWNG